MTGSVSPLQRLQQTAEHKELLLQGPPGIWEVLWVPLSTSACVCAHSCVFSEVTSLTWNVCSFYQEQRRGSEGDDLGHLV